MFATLHSGTVVQCLEYAYKYSLVELKECALKYTAKNYKKFRKKSEWSQLDKEILIDVMKRIDYNKFSS
jgi:hypothetical protein